MLKIIYIIDLRMRGNMRLVSKNRINVICFLLLVIVVLSIIASVLVSMEGQPTNMVSNMQIKEITKITNEQTDRQTSSSITSHLASKTLIYLGILAQNGSISNNTLKKNRNLKAQRDEFTKRMARITNVCKMFPDLKWLPESRISFDPQKKLSYCQVAKAGCTFWFRVFALLNKQKQYKKQNITSIFQISRRDIHYVQDLKSSRQVYNSSIASSSFRFFFSRNPYKRLWASYLDKEYLIDFRKMCKVRTFSEFVKYSLQKPQKGNEHWRPVYESCNPCVYKPHFVGTVETFKDDMTFILKESGYEDIIFHKGEFNYALEEVLTLAEYNYWVFLSKNVELQKCMTEKDLLKILWDVFQINGYISIDSKFPDNLNTYNLDSAKAILAQEIENNPLSKQDSKKQKTFFIQEAYKSLDDSTLLKLQIRYKIDFLLFGYNPLPVF